MTTTIDMTRDRIQPARSEAPSVPILDRLARKLVLGMLGNLKTGMLTIWENGRSCRFGSDIEIVADMTVHHPSFYRAVLLRGSLGAAESFMAGHWSSSRLVDLLRLMVRNREMTESMETSWASMSYWARGLLSLGHAVLRSRRHIAAHYDLGNDFFCQFLDPTLTYSAGIFPDLENSSMEEASVHKIDRLCRKLQLKPGDHLLEVGSGWGALALHAAREYDCRVTTTTISSEQYHLVRDRVSAAALEDRIQVLFKDYRQLEGEYDKIVSVEMIEAIGHSHLPDYFRRLSRLLRPNGLLAIQAITIDDRLYDQARRRMDFIKQYIFPGSCIPSLGHMIQTAASQTDMRLVHVEDITVHYERTMQHWRAKFMKNLSAVEAMGFDEAFINMWLFYLAYCEAGFAERNIGDVQMLFAKPRARTDNLLGML